MGIDYIFWDKDGTFYDHKHPHEKNGLYPGIKDVISKISSERQGIITNSPCLDLFLDRFDIKKYFNPKLIFSADTEKEKLLTNYDNSFRKKMFLTGDYLKDDMILTEYIEKPSIYMFRKACEVLNTTPERCLMIDDSWQGILPAEVIGMKSIYLNGLEDYENWNTSVSGLSLHPTKIVTVGNIKELRTEIKRFGFFNKQQHYFSNSLKS